MAGQNEKNPPKPGKDVNLTIFEDSDDDTHEAPRGRSIFSGTSGQTDTRARTPPRRPLVPRVSETTLIIAQPPTTRTMFPRGEQESMSLPMRPAPRQPLLPRREQTAAPLRKPTCIPPHLRDQPAFTKPVENLTSNILRSNKWREKMEVYDKSLANLEPEGREEALARFREESEWKYKQEMALKYKGNTHGSNPMGKSPSHTLTQSEHNKIAETSAAYAKLLQEQLDALLAQSLQDEEWQNDRTISSHDLAEGRGYVERERDEIICMAQGMLRTRTTVPFQRLANMYNRRFAGNMMHWASEVLIPSSGGGKLMKSRTAPWRTAADLLALSRRCSEFSMVVAKHSSGNHLGATADHFSDDEEIQEYDSKRQEVILDDNDGMMSPKRKSGEDDDEDKENDANGKKPRYRV